MITDLDKYGLVALTIVVVLILFIAMNDMGDDADLDLNGVYFTDSDPVETEEATLPEEPTLREESVVVVSDPVGETGAPRNVPRQDFDFMEEPVNYPGQPAQRPARQRGGAAQHSLTIHHVQKGDTLSLISKKFYGSTKWWKTIVDANPGLNPKSLAIGDRIRIPSLEGVTNKPVPSSRALRNTAQSKISSSGVKSRTYRVKKGDTLGKIAKNYYGNSGKWEKIYVANKQKISDPKRLQVGVELNIPR